MAGKPHLETWPGVGVVVRDLLKARGMSQADLCAATGLSRKTVNVMATRDSLTLATARAVSGALGVDVEAVAKGVAGSSREQVVREYLAEARLELVKAGMSDPQIDRALALIQSASWAALWESLRGTSPARDGMQVAVDGMRVATELTRRAMLAAAQNRFNLDGRAAAAANEVTRIQARNRHLLGPSQPPVSGESASTSDEAATAAEDDQRRA